MQQKQLGSRQEGARLGVFLAGLAVVIGGGLLAVMMLDVPAPTHAIEKPLDAGAFLEQKQP